MEYRYEKDEYNELDDWFDNFHEHWDEQDPDNYHVPFPDEPEADEELRFL